MKKFRNSFLVEVFVSKPCSNGRERRFAERRQPVLVAKKGNSAWNELGVGSGDAACLLNCGSQPEDTYLDLWAAIVRKRDLKELQKVRKVELQQGSDEWLQWRRQGLGGSEVGCVLGANPYSDSRADRVWARKLPADHPDALPEVKSNPAMARGQKLEPAARSLYESLYGWKAEPVCCIHDEFPYVRASLDGWNEEKQISLEIKCSGQRNHQVYLDIGRITDPLERQQAYWYKFPYYLAQVQYQLLITGARYAHFCAYSDAFEGSDRLAVFELYPQPKTIEFLLDRVKTFWGYVESRCPPPPEFLVRCDWLPHYDDLKVPNG